jgi:mRNA interferase HicA
MKRSQLLKHLKKHGATLLREGSRHSIYRKGQLKTQIPRHREIMMSWLVKSVKILIFLL